MPAPIRVLGVDPGATGAVALYDTRFRTLLVDDVPIASVKIGTRQRKQINEIILADTIRDYRPDVAYIERVHALPKQGVTSSFSFGMAYGLVRGILAALQVPVFLITPNEWKRVFRLGPDKNEARLVASRMFPMSADHFQRVRDDGRAEAALLALFGSRQDYSS